MEVVEQNHRREVVVKRFVDIELSPKKAKKMAQACGPPSDAASGLWHVALSSRQKRRRSEANRLVIATGVQSDAFDTLFLRKGWKRYVVCGVRCHFSRHCVPIVLWKTLGPSLDLTPRFVFPFRVFEIPFPSEIVHSGDSCL